MVFSSIIHLLDKTVAHYRWRDIQHERGRTPSPVFVLRAKQKPDPCSGRTAGLKRLGIVQVILSVDLPTTAMVTAMVASEQKQRRGLALWPPESPR